MEAQKLRNPNVVRIFDTTLRDGEQTPGVSLLPEEKLAVARQLDELGVDTIEAGFPITSPGEQAGIKLIAKEGLRAEICGLARAVKGDIDLALDCDVRCVHTFIATSDIHLKYKLKMTREQVIQRAVESVEYAKSHGVVVEFSAEDSTRTDVEYLKQVFKATVDAGADRINIPDTVGAMIPQQMYKIVNEVSKVISKPISVHCHNDFGLAVANSLAGIEAGASQAHVTINGLGERAGNASLEELVTILHLLYGKKTNIAPKFIYETSQLVSRLTGVIIQPNKAIVGENAFAHESGIHTHGVVAKPLTYEVIKPEYVGRRRKLVAGKHAGAHGIKAELEDMGIHLTEEQLREVVNRVKELGDKGKMVTDADLLGIAEAVSGEVTKAKRAVELHDLAVVTGIKVIPTASVKLTINGVEYIAAETGVGPVDAAIKAIQKLSDKLNNVRLREYRLEALTGGSDAMAEVLIKVEDNLGNVVSARAAREDIVMASVEAMINGINKILLKQRGASEK